MNKIKNKICLLIITFLILGLVSIGISSADDLTPDIAPAGETDVLILDFVMQNNDPNTAHSPDNITVEFSGDADTDVTNVTIYNESDGIFGTGSTWTAGQMVISGYELIPNSGQVTFTIKFNISGSAADLNTVDAIIYALSDPSTNLSMGTLPYDPAGFTTIDNAAPVITINEPTGNVSGDATVNITVEDASTVSLVTYRIINDTSAEMLTWTTLAAPYLTTWDTTTVPDGNYNIEVNATDENGFENLGVSSLFTVDNTAPSFYDNIPFIATNDPTPFIQAWFDDGAGSGVEIATMRLNDMLVGFSANSTQINFTMSTQSDGTVIEVYVEVVDYAGKTNFTTWSFTIDLADPTPAEPAELPPYSNTNVSLDWSANPGSDTSGIASYTVWNSSDNSTWTMLVDAELNTSYEHAGISDNETQYYKVETIDNAGNSANSSVVTTIVDAADPTIGAVNLNVASPTSINTNIEVNVTTTDVASGVATVTFDVVDADTDTVVIDDQAMTYNDTSGLAEGTIASLVVDGNYVITVTSTDNVSSTNSSQTTLTVDTTPPVLTHIAPENNSYVDGNIFITKEVTDLELYGVYWRLLNASNTSDVIVDYQQMGPIVVTANSYDVDTWLGDPTDLSYLDENYYWYDNPKREIVVSNGIAYVAEDDYFTTYDVSDPDDIIPLDGIGSYSNIYDVKVQGDYAYLSTNSGDYLRIIDVSDPSDLQGITSIYTLTTIDDLYTLEVQDNLLYLVGEDAVQIMDISNPLTPSPLGIYTFASLDDIAYGSAVQDGVLYVARYSNGLFTINVSDPSNPTLLDSYDYGDYHYDVKVNGDVAYLAGYGPNDFWTVDISDPSDLGAEMDSIGVTSNYGNDIALWENIAYVGDRGGYLNAFDISDPSNLDMTDSIYTDSSPVYVDVDYNYRYNDYWDTTGVDDGLYILVDFANDTVGNNVSDMQYITVDNTDPTAPTGLTATSLPGANQLQWTAATDEFGLAEYTIYRSTSPLSGYSELDSTNATSFDDTTGNDGTAYYYYVTAVDNADNEGPGSNFANAIFQEGVPTKVELIASIERNPTLGATSVEWYDEDYWQLPDNALASDNLYAVGIDDEYLALGFEDPIDPQGQVTSVVLYFEQYVSDPNDQYWEIDLYVDDGDDYQDDVSISGTGTESIAIADLTQLYDDPDDITIEDIRGTVVEFYAEYDDYWMGAHYLDYAWIEVTYTAESGESLTIPVGAQVKLTANILDAYDNPVESDSSTLVTLANSDTGIGSLDETMGVVTNGAWDPYFTAVTTSTGTATITATSGTLESSFVDITVVSGPAAQVVALQPSSTPVGDDMTVTVQIRDQYGNLVLEDNSTHVWLTVSGSAVAPATATTVTDGQATIVVTDTIAETITITPHSSPALTEVSTTGTFTGAAGAETVGVYDNAGTWALWNGASADIVGFGWTNTVPIVGDWDGDGVKEVGIYNTGGNNFLIQTDTGFDVIGLGWAGVTPVVGDWDGDGSDEVGVYDNMGTWALWNGASADIVGFGWSGTEPVVGDWDGDGVTEVGIYNTGGNNFLVQTDTGFDVIGLGWTGVTPVVGDWNTDGTDQVGVYDNIGTWALWNGASADIVGFGFPGTEPVVGDWNGDGLTEVGIYNTAGNNFLVQTDTGFDVIGLGWTGVTPVAGYWG